MRTCVFAGPSIFGWSGRPPEIDIFGPAKRGDIFSAVRAGYDVIGLVDGAFGMCASVWHKEILFALSKGRSVLGAASMGALRAAECHRFGMIPVGRIAHRYLTGDLRDDAAVALTHGPAEYHYEPFTEPLVDVEATLKAMLNASVLTRQSFEDLLSAFGEVHFANRTIACMSEIAVEDEEGQRRFADAYRRWRVRAKQADACELFEMASDPPPLEIRDWSLANSRALHALRSSERPLGNEC